VGPGRDPAWRHASCPPVRASAGPWGYRPVAPLPHQGRAEGLSVEKLTEQGHAEHVRVVRTHATGGEGDHDGIGESRQDPLHQPIHRSVHLAQSLSGRGRRTVVPQRMVGIGAMPQALNGRMELTHDHHPQLPVGTALLEQPETGLSPAPHGLDQAGGHAPATVGAGPGQAVNVFPGRIVAEPGHHLAEQGRRTGRRGNARIMGAPADEALDLIGAIQVEIGRVEDHRPGLQALGTWGEGRALLPNLVGGGIEANG
jgi:hypothetical protein